MQKGTGASKVLARLADKFDITERAAASFFRTLQEQRGRPDQLVVLLQEMTNRQKKLLERFAGFKCYFPEVETLREQAGRAVVVGEFYHAEQQLLQAREGAQAAIAELKEYNAEPEGVIKEWQVSEAEICTNLAMLHKLQYRYSEAAQFFQAAAQALPEERKQEQASCLYQAGALFWDSAHYAEAQPFYEQCLFIAREIRDRKREATLLRDIGVICIEQGDKEKALEYLKQCLKVSREIGHKEAEALALENIASIYNGKEDYAKALQYLEQSLSILHAAGEKEGESKILNNIGAVYEAQQEYTLALDYYEQALALSRANSDATVESNELNNISRVYETQGDYDTALKYLEQDLALMRECEAEKQECVVLNNIGMLYSAKNDHATALKYHEQSLEKVKEVGSAEVEASIRANIAWVYATQGKAKKAEPHLSRAVQLAEELDHPDQVDWRTALEEIRSELKKPPGLINQLLHFLGRRG